jgi:BirA family biotin operon repressor/biotin-[acetyl-CoA-carboxylase] ligase
MTAQTKRDADVWQELIRQGQVEGWPLYFFDKTESTNTVGKNLARQGGGHGTVIVADSQLSGRGRLKRGWHSPAGVGLYFSVILRPNLPLEKFPLLTLTAGVACAKVLEGHCRAKIVLKWPNDLLLNNKKIGGILTETGPLSSDAPFAVVGIGININTGPDNIPSDLAQKATSLFIETGSRFCRGLILKDIVRELHRQVGLLEEGHAGDVFRAWQNLDGFRNRTVTWVNSRGELVSGQGLGLDDAGNYRIRDKNGKEYFVLSGDVELARKEKGAS